MDKFLESLWVFHHWRYQKTAQLDISNQWEVLLLLPLGLWGELLDHLRCFPALYVCNSKIHPKHRQKSCIPILRNLAQIPEMIQAASQMMLASNQKSSSGECCYRGHLYVSQCNIRHREMSNKPLWEQSQKWVNLTSPTERLILFVRYNNLYPSVQFAEKVKYG